MNIKDFLIDNYIYIIIVIVLIIITIIGFLADKKTKGKTNSKDILPNNNPNMGNANFGMVQNPQQPMNYQPQMASPEVANPAMQGPLYNNNVPTEPVNFGQQNNNQVPMGGAINPVGNATMQESPNNGMNVVPGTMEGMIVNQNVAPVPMQPVVEPVPSVPVNPEPMYQPAPEVTPVIMPTDPTDNMQNYNQSMNLNNNQVNNMPSAMNMVPNNGGVSPIPVNVNPAPIPTPVVPTPPVAPIPTAPMTPVNPTPMPNTTVPNPVPAPQPQPVNNSQFNYVYGNQQGNQNNNGYM